MKLDTPQAPRPDDADTRLQIAPVVCYPPDSLPAPKMDWFADVLNGMTQVDEIVAAPREAGFATVPAGHVFRILSVDGPQVGDLNLWNAADLSERFYSGKTRALHGTHLSTGDRMWSSFPTMRPMATVIHDTLDWYGFDEFGGSVHDVIGTRCDPYTNTLLSGGQYHHCCHSNLTRGLADHTGLSLKDAEPLVHDVLNVFMCTGFMRDTGQYFMKASPVRPGDHLDFLAEMDLVVGISACPGGDCSTTHSSDTAQCHPLVIQVFKPRDGVMGDWAPSEPNAYDRTHGR